MSSSIVSASSDFVKEKKKLHIYYCICGEYLLIIDTVIHKLPRRATDGSFIINTKKRISKFNVIQGDSVMLKRKSLPPTKSNIPNTSTINTETNLIPSNTDDTESTLISDSSSLSNDLALFKYEKQHRKLCPKCKLFVCYDQKGPFTYFLNGSLKAESLKA